jgi:hypothetical protein
MTWSSFLLILAFLVAAAIQYGLAIYAIRDLMQRERLRGANKFSWVLIILCLPFVGTLLYIALATDGLPIPRPHPTSTWPGRRWRGVRKVAQAGESFIRGAEPPREQQQAWEDFPDPFDDPIPPDDRDGRSGVW